MNKIQLIISVLLCYVLITSPAIAAKRASTEKGEELYKSMTVGGSQNGKSCFSCHDKQDKKMLKKVVKMSRDELTSIINKCITGPMQGKALAEDSVEMKSLRMYLVMLTDDCY